MYSIWSTVDYKMSVSNILDHRNKISVGYMPAEVTDLIKKVETLQEENTNLRKHCEMLESLVMQVHKDSIEGKQVIEQQFYSQKQKILEEIDERFEAMAKKEPSLLERIRLYFVNKKMRSDVMNQLL